MSIYELLRPNNYDIFGKSFTAPIINAQDSLVAEDIFADTVTANQFIGPIVGSVTKIFGAAEHITSSGETGSGDVSLSFLEFSDGDFNLGPTGPDGFMKRVVKTSPGGYLPIDPVFYPTSVNTVAFHPVTNELYIGGGFTNLGPSGANYVAKYNGSQWEPIDPLVQPGDTVYALAFDSSNDLLIGGSFVGLDGTINGIARYSGGSWSALDPADQPDFVGTILVDGTDIWIGGSFTLTGPIRNVAIFSGGSYSAPDPANQPAAFTYVGVIIKVGTDIWIGGQFTGLAGTIDYIAIFSGGSWSAPDPANQPNNPVEGMDVDSNGDVYVGGGFTNLAGNINIIAKYSGGSWSAIDPNTQPSNGIVDFVKIINDTLWIGGSFLNLGLPSYVAYFDGSWKTPVSIQSVIVTSSTTSTVTVIGYNSDTIYIGGTFIIDASGTALYNIVKLPDSTININYSNQTDMLTITGEHRDYIYNTNTGSWIKLQ